MEMTKLLLLVVLFLFFIHQVQVGGNEEEEESEEVVGERAEEEKHHHEAEDGEVIHQQKAEVLSEDNADEGVPSEWLTRKKINSECSDRICWSSDSQLPVCGSDNKTYVNPGVFKCAVDCNPKLKLLEFNPCASGEGGEKKEEIRLLKMS